MHHPHRPHLYRPYRPSHHPCRRRYQLQIEESQFDMAQYTSFCDSVAPEVAALKARQRGAMDVQLQAEADSLARLEAARAARHAAVSCVVVVVLVQKGVCPRVWWGLSANLCLFLDF